MSRPILFAAAAVAATFSAPFEQQAAAQQATDRDGYPVVGVRLSERELERSRPVRLSDGRVVLRPRNNGIPFLFGLGDAQGKPSGLPTTNGVTPSIDASTPSGGLVPGQEPE